MTTHETESASTTDAAPARAGSPLNFVVLAVGVALLVVMILMKTAPPSGPNVGAWLLVAVGVGVATIVTGIYGILTERPRRRAAGLGIALAAVAILLAGTVNY